MRGLHHVGVTVRDLGASIRFYHDVLGLEFVNEPTPWFEGDSLSKGVGVSDASLRQVSLALGDAILEYRSPPSETSRPLASNNSGASHVAFVVDDGVLAGWRWVYFEDPDGFPLDLVEVAYTRAEERAAGIAAYRAGRR